MHVHEKRAEPWTVTLVDTGDESMTGGRLRRVADHVKNEEAFCFTYGDGVGDVDISASIAFHKKHGKAATLTATYPPGRFGALDIQNHQVMSFKEKPKGDGAMINGGFFVLTPQVLKYLDDDSTVWEQEPLMRLAEEGPTHGIRASRFLAAYGHAARQAFARRALDDRQSTLEEVGLSMIVNPEFWRGKRVLLTGHTGFKGSWLSLWLQSMGANVHGLALAPPTSPSLFNEARVGDGMISTIGDIRDYETVRAVMASFQPEVVLHMAAQPLVRLSYHEPVATYATNVMGTVHVFGSRSPDEQRQSHRQRHD